MIDHRICRELLCVFLFLFVLFFILCEKSLDSCDDLGRAIDDVGELLHRIGGILNTDIDKLNVTFLVNAEHTYRLNGDTGSSACAEVLGLALGAAVLVVVIKTACRESKSYLGDRNNSCSGLGAPRLFS